MGHSHANKERLHSSLPVNSARIILKIRLSSLVVDGRS